MTEHPKLKIRNIKISLHLKFPITIPKKRIYLLDKCVVTIYPKNDKLINVTKINSVRSDQNNLNMISRPRGRGDKIGNRQ